ncbi:MAG: T9SS type A sorting domain-containing protein [Bacteroidota bacterium]
MNRFFLPFTLILLFLIGCDQTQRESHYASIQDVSSRNEANRLTALPIETVRSLAMERKAMKTQTLTNFSPLENVQELGPNKDNLLCGAFGGLCVSGMIKELVIDSEDDQTFVIATETSGAWVSYDQGSSWEPIDSDWAGLGLTWLVQSKENPDLFYFCGVGPGLFIWDKSKDHGLEEWVGTIDGVPTSTFPVVTNLKIDPENPEIHYLTTNASIYRYNGEAYEDISEPPLDGPLFSNFAGDIEVIPGVGLASHHGNAVKIRRQDGSSSTFQTGISTNWGEIAYSPSDPNIVYHFAITEGTMVMFRSRNGGIDWEQLELPWFMADGRHHGHDQTLEIYPYSPGTELILCGTVNMNMAIVENTHTEAPLFKGLSCAHGDFHGSLPYQDDIYVYDDGGLYVFEIADLQRYFLPGEFVSIKSSTRSIASGLRTLQATDISYQAGTGRLAIGLWHNGTWLRQADGQYNWMKGGDGFESAFHPEDENIVYTSSQNNRFSRYNIATGGKSSISNVIRRGPFRSKLFTHPDFPQELFYLDEGLWTIPNAEDCLSQDCKPTQILDFPEPEGVRLGSENNGRQLYIFNQSNLMKLAYPKDSVGAQIFDVNTLPFSPPAFEFKDVFVQKENGRDIIYGIALTDLTKQQHTLLKLNSAGELLDFQSISLQKGLPIETLFVPPFQSDEFILGTRAGLYHGQFGREFPVPDLSIPSVRIYDFKYDEAENILYISTYGRGVWQANISRKAEPSMFTENIQVYPNPTSGLINLSSTVREEIVLMDAKGAILDEFSVDTRRVSYESISHLPSGMYFLRGRQSNRTVKLVKY